MDTALLIIDMQMDMALRTAAGADRANPDAESRVAELLALFRSRDLPVLHVLHDEPGTDIAIGGPGHPPMPCAQPAPGEPVFIKTISSSAFTGTGLTEHLHATGISRLVVAGAVAGFCITSSVRAASDLGFHVLLAQDAVVGFGQHRADGSFIPAETVLDVTLALLGADFAQVLPTAAVAGSLDTT